MSKLLPPVLCVVGARPNFMKMAPILEAFARAEPAIPATLVHTGQHYDVAMNEQHFAALGLPKPDISLEVGSGSHAKQTAAVMEHFEPVLDEVQPAAVLVVGDVNSTLACTLVASKKGVPVIHVEAGLRSYDRTMPEEINRVLTDQIADLLFTTEAKAEDNLAREGVPAERVRFVGNVMIDSVHRNREKAVSAAQTLAALDVDPAKPWGLVTLHRPSNVDDAAVLANIVGTLNEAAERLPLVFPVHPRTRARMSHVAAPRTTYGSAGTAAPVGAVSDRESARSALQEPPEGTAPGAVSRSEAAPTGATNLHLLDPVDYLTMLGLLQSATLVITDSGGLQEETTALGIPCLTVRENTERPITIEQGTNTLVGTDRATILAAVDNILTTGGKQGRIPEYWDGQTAERIATELNRWLGRSG
ncbi:UDP-N-acetyl glucosamine 2-epimerase [Spiribacter halobius]|uniref:UDP-N-acetylglucosamine 2-epimerase (Non-hydrolyzing) n=1 Tax=Sediminicurvatus halobius TaxID=2182432 RepID=A0A2U2N0V0_9GAMM|nr:UDP-N-acetyl glucosamine 2-epimerase [Spiribacter halobius]PWG62688.1 UDP-N-acetylglucosamine 2-epimerase (non-hydrolyzing) [Spiribacter halobius]UEX77357.1 UDP-N-acetyl glucosamine 2-epimerase [Spiribacter halobius]